MLLLVSPGQCGFWFSNTLEPLARQTRLVPAVLRESTRRLLLFTTLQCGHSIAAM